MDQQKKKWMAAVVGTGGVRHVLYMVDSADFVDETTYEYAVWEFQCVTQG